MFCFMPQQCFVPFTSLDFMHINSLATLTIYPWYVDANVCRLQSQPCLYSRVSALVTRSARMNMAQYAISLMVHEASPAFVNIQEFISTFVVNNVY